MTFQSFKKALQVRLRAYSILIMVLMILAQCLALQWFGFELITHFTLHAAVLVLIGSFAFSWRWRLGLWAVVTMVLLWVVQPFSGSLKTPLSHSMMVYNIQFDNDHKNHEVYFLSQTNADFLALIEMGASEWQQAFSSLKQRYPYACGHDVESPFAMQFMSQKPLLSCQVHFVDIYPYIRAVLSPQQTVFVLHPPPPINRELAEDRQRYFEKLATIIGQENNAVLVVGDLNNTPFSPVYRRFVHAAQLQESMKYGTPTWKPFLLPIDRVLHRQVIIKTSPLHWQYSDHRPIWIEWQPEK